jgi:L-fuculose-phosphate aldolase
MTTSLAARRDIVRVCRRLYERGLIAGPDGNVSVRLSQDRVLITPAGQSKVDVTEYDLVEMSLDGTTRRGSGRPSSEAGMHLRVYRHRPDVQAVVHAHPPIATGFASAGEGFSQCVLPEMILQMGSVPLVPYATPGSEEVGDRCEPFLREHNALLLANHGATTMGSTLTVAHQRMESLEHTAHVVLVARLLGRVNTLSADAVQALVGARTRAYPGAVFPGCETPPASTRSSV